MKIQRTRNATRNIVFDGMLKMVNMVIPFIMRSILLNTLGVSTWDSAACSNPSSLF